MTSALENEIIQIEAKLKLVVAELESLNDNNFEKKIERVKFLNQNILEKRALLQKSYSKEELVIYNAKLDPLVKLIEKKFDDMLLEKKNLQNNISEELKKIANKRKLANYQR